MIGTAVNTFFNDDSFVISRIMGAGVLPADYRSFTHYLNISIVIIVKILYDSAILSVIFAWFLIIFFNNVFVN